MYSDPFQSQHFTFKTCDIYWAIPEPVLPRDSRLLLEGVNKHDRHCNSIWGVTCTDFGLAPQTQIASLSTAVLTTIQVLYKTWPLSTTNNSSISPYQLNKLQKNMSFTWKNLVWKRVKAQPMRRSSSCRASTDLDSFSLGSTKLFMAALMSRSVMAENLARKIICGKVHLKILTYWC